MVALMIAVAVFCSGILAGRWAVKNQVSTRVRQQLASKNGWVSTNTHLFRIETKAIELPDASGWGGGVKALSDGRILYATGHGAFGIIGLDGKARPLGFGIDMNLAALMQHPVAQMRDFNPNRVRVADINLTPIDATHAEILVSHHHFDAAQQCIDLWLSRGVVDIGKSVPTLSSPFHKVTSTAPCITFSLPTRTNEPFNGWASGGRIVRVAAGTVLLSTGDHRWVGLEGYPALSQSDESTLGKILSVDLASGRSRILAKGFRNPQGLIRDSKGRIWETEHGPRGGDELNLIEEGKNYGWPNVTYGTDYGPRPWPLNEHQGRHDRGAPPVFSWVPSIGVSNLIEVTDKQFPDWAGDLLVLSLANQSIHRLRLQGNQVVYDEPIPIDGHRLRDICELPDGRFAILTDEASVILVRNGDPSGNAPYLDARRQLPRSADMSPAERAAAVAGAFQRDAGGHRTVAVNAAPAAEQHGRAIYQARCAHCHSTNDAVVSVAPNLAGIVGRRVGSTEFPYSNALAAREAVWTAEDAIAFALDPQRLYPGTAMAPVQLSDSEQIDLMKYFEAIR